VDNGRLTWSAYWTVLWACTVRAQQCACTISKPSLLTFVAVLVSYDEWGTVATPASAVSAPHLARPRRDTAMQQDGTSLSGQHGTATGPKRQQQQQPPSHSDPARHRRPEATPEPRTLLSSSISPSITRLASFSVRPYQSRCHPHVTKAHSAV